MKRLLLVSVGVVDLAAMVAAAHGDTAHDDAANRDETKRDRIPHGRRLFERETFAGNGRTCQTCHTAETGTVSAEDARKRFRKDPDDPVLMLDGRQPDLESQAIGAILDHAQGGVPTYAEAHALAEFQKTRGFFSSQELWAFSRDGPAPGLPEGRTASERRGRRFFEDVPPNPADGLTSGLCAHCHSGPLLNTTNEFAAPFIPSPAPVPPGQRFLSVGVSEFSRGQPGEGLRLQCRHASRGPSHCSTDTIDALARRQTCRRP